MTDDAELLRRYLDGSQASFAELVRCHIGVVHGTALRMLAGDAHLADEVTQGVFTGLARKAASLANRPTLAGWLYLSTHYEAAKAVRSEQRRRGREQKALAMQQIDADGAPGPDWTALRPVLDEALREIPEVDRDALLLRFFQARSLADVGQVLGLTENAARMRVERALDKLRGKLVRRGIASTGAALGTLLAEQVATGAPVTLAASVASAALAAVPAGGGAAVIFMSMTKLQMGIAAALAVAGGSTLLSEIKAGAALRAENAALVAQIAASSTTAQGVAAVPVADVQREEATLAELRSEEAALHQRLARTQRPTIPSPHEQMKVTPGGKPLFELRELDKQPAPRRRVQPTYPEAMKASRITGEVTLTVTVGDDGRMHDIVVERATNDAFSDAARSALEQWVYDPAEKGGLPVNVRVQMPFVFAIDSDKNVNWF